MSRFIFLLNLLFSLSCFAKVDNFQSILAEAEESQKELAARIKALVSDTNTEIRDSVEFRREPQAEVLTAELDIRLKPQ